MATRIKRTLKLMEKGPDVAALQRALATAGLSISEDERRESRFGLSTRLALTEFQTQSDLRVTGLLDDATAGYMRSVERSRRRESPVPRPRGGWLLRHVVARQKRSFKRRELLAWLPTQSTSLVC